MIRPILLMTLVFAANGCFFDEQRQFDLRYPVTLELKNSSPVKVEINYISSSPNSSHLFSLYGSLLSPGDTYGLRISEYTYKDIRSGYFVLEGVCGDNKNWQVDGTVLKQKLIENAKERHVSILIENC